MIKQEGGAIGMPQAEFRMNVHAQRRRVTGPCSPCPGQERRMRRVERKLCVRAKLIGQRGKHVSRPMVHQVVRRVPLRREAPKHGRSGIADQNQRPAFKLYTVPMIQPAQNLKALATDARFDCCSVWRCVRQSVNGLPAAKPCPV